jgi:alpha-tubulin suppressor-like RCC1 family protein
MELPPTPPSPVDGLPTALALAIDEGWNTCAVTPDRGVACWGVGIRGALGDEPEVRGRPGPIAGLADVAAILPAQTPHACALGLDGSVACFGAGNNRQLGSAANETGWTLTPSPVEGLPRSTALAVGFGFTCALAADGTVRCWGRNESGQLGDGTREARQTPAPVPGLAGVTAISAGREQLCAVLADRTVRCWGDMLATRCPDQHTAPVTVPDLADVAQLAVGWDHACATITDGTVRCWGEGDGGQIGDGGRMRRFTPVAVPGLADAVAVETGDGVACALRKDGTVACWGKNQCGQADGGASARTHLTEPAAIPGVTDAVELAVGGMQSCVRRRDGGVLCWGATTPSQLGACLAAW